MYCEERSEVRRIPQRMYQTGVESTHMVHTWAADRDTCNVDTHTDVDVYLTRACTVLAQSVGDGPITTIG